MWAPIADYDPVAELALLGMVQERPAFVALTPDARSKPAFALFRVLAGLPLRAPRPRWPRRARRPGVRSRKARVA